MKTYHVYILQCADDSFYTGITSELDERIYEHQSGHDPRSYTFSRRPLELVYSVDFAEVNDAIAFEKQDKGWRRSKKIALIEGRFNDLPALSIAYHKKVN